MANHSVYTFFSVHNCLDEEFDAPDIAADHDLCRAIVAGNRGLHPDAWGAHDPLTLPPPRFRRPWRPPIGHPRDRAVDPAWEVELRRRLGVENPIKPAPVVDSYVPPPAHGELQLTCDVCRRARFHITVEYHGDRSMRVAAIRAMGRTAGWTCIVGTDRCPRCSTLPNAVPEAKGNGAGKDEGNEQHA